MISIEEMVLSVARNMLELLNQPRLSTDSLSPRLQHQSRHVSSSPRTTTDTARRKSTISEPSPTPAPAPSRKVVQYVSRGTQYSPMIQKMEDVRPDLTSSKSDQTPRTELRKTTIAAPTSLPPSPPKHIFKAESPSIKRRQSPDTDQSAVSKNEELAPKRTRPGPPAVKILPAKYEECAIENLVVLIASMISELIETNDALPPRRDPVLTRFHSR